MALDVVLLSPEMVKVSVDNSMYGDDAWLMRCVLMGYA